MKNNNKKIPKTFTLSIEVYEEFKKMADKLAINKSKYIENSIKDFIRKNKELINEYD